MQNNFEIKLISICNIVYYLILIEKNLQQQIFKFYIDSLTQI